MFAEYGEDTQRIIDAQPLTSFPIPDDLRQRYQALKGIDLTGPNALTLLMPLQGRRTGSVVLPRCGYPSGAGTDCRGTEKDPAFIGYRHRQEDGYLAACEVIRRTVDLDKKEITREDIVERSAVDAYTGRKVKPGEIETKDTASDYDAKLMLDDRVKAMSEDLFQLLLDTGGPHQETVIFCTRDHHANQIMIALNNLYSAWCPEGAAHAEGMVHLPVHRQSRPAPARQRLDPGVSRLEELPFHRHDR